MTINWIFFILWIHSNYKFEKTMWLNLHVFQCMFVSMFMWQDDCNNIKNLGMFVGRSGPGWSISSPALLLNASPSPACAITSWPETSLPEADLAWAQPCLHYKEEKKMEFKAYFSVAQLALVRLCLRSVRCSNPLCLTFFLCNLAHLMNRPKEIIRAWPK